MHNASCLMNACVQEACEELVDTCISPLALLLSDLELTHLREELGGKVSLTC